jgi:hypothetical protein
VYNYNFSPIQAGLVVAVVPLGLIPMFALTSHVHNSFGFLRSVHIVEAVQAVGLALMLCAGSSSAVDLVVFMIGSVLFYVGNFSLALLYGKLRSSFVVPQHYLLNLETSTALIWSVSFGGYFMGPILNRVLLQASMSQHLFAVSLAVVFVGLAVGQEIALRVLLWYDQWSSFITACGIKVSSFVAISSIPAAGRGRFVHDDVPKGTIVRRLVVGSDELRVFRNEEEIEAACASKTMSVEKLAHFGQEEPGNVDWLRGAVVVMRHPGVVNHPSPGMHANVEIEYMLDGNQQVFISRTMRDVAAGEEFLTDYRFCGVVQWFRDYLRKRGNASMRQYADEADEAYTRARQPDTKTTMASPAHAERVLTMSSACLPIDK